MFQAIGISRLVGGEAESEGNSFLVENGCGSFQLPAATKSIEREIKEDKEDQQDAPSGGGSVRGTGNYVEWTEMAPTGGKRFGFKPKT